MLLLLFSAPVPALSALAQWYSTHLVCTTLSVDEPWSYDRTKIERKVQDGRRRTRKRKGKRRGKGKKGEKKKKEKHLRPWSAAV